MTNEVNTTAVLDAVEKEIATWRNTHTALLGTISVPWDKWAAIPAHPAQRQTAVHAAKLTVAGILSKPLAVHQRVAAVAVGDIDELKRLFAVDPQAFLEMQNVTKLDGHTRTFAQREGRAPKPETVVVDVYGALNKAESTGLYKAFDSTTSSKNPKDTIQSILNLAGISPQSALFQQGKLGNSLKVADSILQEGTIAVRPVKGKKGVAAQEADTIEAALNAIMPQLALAKAWKEEIETLDGLNLDAQVMATNAGALAAYMVVLRHNPVKGEEFLSAIRRGEGTSDATVADGVYIGRTVDDHIRLRRGSKLKGKERTERTISIILNAYKGWLVDEKFDALKYPSTPGVIASMFEEERKTAAKAARLAAKMADAESGASHAGV